MKKHAHLAEHSQLLKIFHTRFEYLHILLAGDVDRNTVAAALDMTHLSEDTAVR